MLKLVWVCFLLSLSKNAAPPHHMINYYSEITNNNSSVINYYPLAYYKDIFAFVHLLDFLNPCQYFWRNTTKLNYHPIVNFSAILESLQTIFPLCINWNHLHCYRWKIMEPLLFWLWTMQSCWFALLCLVSVLGTTFLRRMVVWWFVLLCLASVLGTAFRRRMPLRFVLQCLLVWRTAFLRRMPLWFVLLCLASVRDGYSETDATMVCLAVFH